MSLGSAQSSFSLLLCINESSLSRRVFKEKDIKKTKSWKLLSYLPVLYVVDLNHLTYTKNNHDPGIDNKCGIKVLY